MTTALLAVAGVMSAPAYAGSSAGSTKVTLAQKAMLTNTADLDFGSIIANGTGVGRVTINANTGARTANANVTLAGAAGFSRATFLATGQSNNNVTFSVASPTILLTGPGTSMLLDTMRINRNTGGQQTLPRTYAFPASGSMNIGFGGRLRVASNQAPGVYSGTFNLTMVYQ